MWGTEANGFYHHTAHATPFLMNGPPLQKDLFKKKCYDPPLQLLAPPKSNSPPSHPPHPSSSSLLSQHPQRPSTTPQLRPLVAYCRTTLAKSTAPSRTACRHPPRCPLPWSLSHPWLTAHHPMATQPCPLTTPWRSAPNPQSPPPSDDDKPVSARPEPLRHQPRPPALWRTARPAPSPALLRRRGEAHARRHRLLRPVSGHHVRRHLQLGAAEAHAHLQLALEPAVLACGGVVQLRGTPRSGAGAGTPLIFVPTTTPGGMPVASPFPHPSPHHHLAVLTTHLERGQLARVGVGIVHKPGGEGVKGGPPWHHV
jgi:hypothetical protein